jgi:hypothetical protein
MQMQSPVLRTVAVLTLFGVSFACVESAVVVYLRALYEPFRLRALAPAPNVDEVFPLLTAEQVRQAGPQVVRTTLVELGREFSTLVMLAAVGFLGGWTFRQWLAGFMIAFGVWDIFYYVFLRLFLGWPASLLTWDILFFLPVPWTGPVISPVIVAGTMIVLGVLILRREAIGRPVRFNAISLAILIAGALIIIVAFCWDYANILAGGRPTWFNWPLFLAGEGIAVAGFNWAFRNRGAAT